MDNNTFEQAINTIIENLDLPPGQGWVTLDELKEAAKKLDGDQNRFDNIMDDKSESNTSRRTQH